MSTPPESPFALAAGLDSGRRTEWTEWLRDPLLSQRLTLESRNHERAWTIHCVTVRAGPRDAPVPVEDRRERASARRRIAIDWPVDCIRTVLHVDGGATTTLGTGWYPCGPQNDVALEPPSLI